MTQFKVGDRVRIYGFHIDDAGHVMDRTIDEVCDNGLLGTDGGEYVHPKQCRRLVKRERRRVWVNVYGGGMNYVAHPTQEVADRNALQSRVECIEMVEVRRKK